MDLKPDFFFALKVGQKSRSEGEVAISVTWIKSLNSGVQLPEDWLRLIDGLEAEVNDSLASSYGQDTFAPQPKGGDLVAIKSTGMTLSLAQ